MRKLINSKKIKKNPTVEPVKDHPPLDDVTIRAVLRRSCNELQEEVFSDSVTSSIRIWVVRSLPTSAETGWIDPEFLKEKGDLSMFWSLYAQRQVILFDEESSLIENSDYHDAW